MAEHELCKTPCGPVFEALEKKTSLKIFMWIIGLLTGFGVVLTFAQMTTQSKIQGSLSDIQGTIKVQTYQMSSIQESVSEIRTEMKQMNGKRGRY